MKRIFAALLTACGSDSTTSGLPAAGSSADSSVGGTHTIANTPKCIGISWWDRMNAGNQRFAESTGNTVYQSGPTGDADTAVQISSIEDAVASGVDAITVIPCKKKEGLHTMPVAGMMPENPAHSLSGGNQQKIVLAKWLASIRDILILNCPTVGVDVGAKSDIHRIVRDLARVKCGADPREIAGIGISAIAAVTPVDEHGNPLHNAILYGNDTRC